MKADLRFEKDKDYVRVYIDVDDEHWFGIGVSLANLNSNMTSINIHMPMIDHLQSLIGKKKIVIQPKKKIIIKKKGVGTDAKK